MPIITKEHREPEIIINGEKLNPGQALTMRVAINSFYGQLKEKGLGGDPIGISLCDRYLKKSEEIIKLMSIE